MNRVRGVGDWKKEKRNMKKCTKNQGAADEKSRGDHKNIKKKAKKKPKKRPKVIA